MERIDARNPALMSSATYQQHISRYFFASRHVPGGRLLDVACGSGYGSAYLGSTVKNDGIVSVDVAFEAVKCTSECFKSLTAVQASGEQLPFPEGCFDGVVSFETIEHVQNPEAMLSECARVLKDDGTLIMSTPNRRLYSFLEKNPYHTREFTIREFIELVRSRFHSVELYGQLRQVVPLLAARRLVAKYVLRGSLGRRVKDAVHRVEARQYAPDEIQGKFQVRPMTFAGRIRFMIEPMYVVVVARKSGRGAVHA